MNKFSFPIKSSLKSLLTLGLITLVLFTFLPELYADGKPTTPQRVFYMGTVGKSSVQMELTFGNGQVSGTYFYESDGRPITVGGQLSSLTEWYDGKKTGSFDSGAGFTPAANRVIGTWSNPSGTVKLPFVLTKIAEYKEKDTSGSGTHGNTYEAYCTYPYFIGNDLLNQGVKLITDDYQEMVDTCKEALENPGNSFAGYSYTLAYLSKNLICINDYEFHNINGAHFVEESSSLVFRITPKALVRVNMSDCFKPNYEKKLSQVVKSRLRKQYRNLPVDPDGTLFEITMPIVHKKSLEFIMPPYRREPIGVGCYNVMVPYEEIREVIREDGPLGEMMNKG